MVGNIKLLKETREQIVTFPEKHNQKTWHCETSMCIAGHAAVLSGCKVSVGYSEFLDENITVMLGPDGSQVNAATFAEYALRLTPEEYEYLFFCMNNEVAIKRVDQVISLWEQGERLDDQPYEIRIEDPETDNDEEIDL